MDFKVKNLTNIGGVPEFMERPKQVNLSHWEIRNFNFPLRNGFLYPLVIVRLIIWLYIY